MGGGGIISGVVTSTTQHYAGRQSLAVNFNGTASGSSSVSFGNVRCPAGPDDYLSCLDSERQSIISIFSHICRTITGHWTSSWYGSLTANAWNTLTLTVPATAIAPFQNLGIQFKTSAGWTGTCYIDSVSWNTPSPDFNLSANPTSLTVKAGTNGTSAITVTPTNGLNGCYTLSASGLPSGVTATFGTNPVTGGEHTDVHGLQHRNQRHIECDHHRTCGLLSHMTTIALTILANTPPAMPTNLVATASDAQVALSWFASATATNYYVKRSTTSGSGYIYVGTNASLTFTNTGLNNGTLYCFVVSAVNAYGESTNSAQVSARPTSSAPTQLGFVPAGNQLQFNWPLDHTGWQLQSQTNSLGVGLGTNWVNVTDSAQTNQVPLTVNPANGAVFFRLVRPY